MTGLNVSIPFEDNDSDSGDDGEDFPLIHDSPSWPQSRLRPSLSRVCPSLSFHEATSPRTIIAILFTIIFILEFGGNLMIVPSIRLYEDIVCHDYYNSLKEGEGHIGFQDRIEERLCKVEEVQNELNIVFAGFRVMGAVFSLIMTVPYGLMMDRVGRKPVLLLSLIGILISSGWEIVVMRFYRVIPFRMLLIAPIFTVIGGGTAVTSMIIHTIGYDVTAEAERANVFMFGACASLVAELIAPTVASSLMMKSPWIPILIGAGILVCGTILITLIPETTHLRAHGTESEAVTPESVSERSIKLDDSTFLAAAMSHLQDIWRRLVGSLFVLNSFPVIILLMTFVVNPFGAQSVGLCIRYISVRFSWSLSQAGYLLSIRALINIFVMLGLIPGLSHYLTRNLRLSSKDKDLLLSKFSVIFLVFGAFLIAASPTVGFTIIGLMIWTLGTGFVSLTRSLITTLVDEHHVGRLYAAVSIVETLGALSAGPLLATLYNLGLHWKGPWVGLPFFLLSLVSLIAGVEVWIFGCVMRKARKEDASYRGEEEESSRSNALLLQPNLLD